MKFRIWRVKNVVSMQFTDTSNLPFERGEEFIFRSAISITPKIYLPGSNARGDFYVKSIILENEQKAQEYIDLTMEALEEYRESLV